MNIKKPQALVIGESFDLVFGAVIIFKRCGFEIDMLTINRSYLKSTLLRSCELVSDYENLLIQAGRKNLDQYDIIIISDDSALKNILDSELDDEIKLKLLPVNNIACFEHIASKIGLSKILFKNHIATPEFRIANNIDETVKSAETLGYPVFVKVDHSNGGNGAFECNNQEDIYKINPMHFNLPILVQKKIEGTELDLSAFYQNGNLIHFHFCEIKKVSQNQYGPSSVRKYFQASEINEQIFEDLVNLGKAIGANGFATISYLKSNDGKGYFIEADMRPNVWTDFTKFIGDDIAKKISAYFEKGEFLNYPILRNEKFPTSMIMPYWLRLSVFEILINRYNVWKFIEKKDMIAQIDSYYHQFLSYKVTNISYKLKRIFNKFRKLSREIKRLPTTIIRLVLPKKEDRIKIKNYLKNFGRTVEE